MVDGADTDVSVGLPRQRVRPVLWRAGLCTFWQARHVIVCVSLILALLNVSMGVFAWLVPGDLRIMDIAASVAISP